MAYQAYGPTTSINNAGNGVAMADNDTLFLASGGWISSYGTGSGNGIYGAGSASIIIDGTVSAYLSAISIGTGASSIACRIGNSGHVISTNSNGVNLAGAVTGSNAGEIIGGAIGIAFHNNSFVNFSNYGTISAITAISVSAETAGNRYDYFNAGAIICSFKAFYGDIGNDYFVNSGTIRGEIDLYSGNDMFDGRDGYVYGEVHGGLGNDTLTGGKSADSLYGDAGDDVINFSIEDAVVNGGIGYDIARNTYNDFGLTFDMGGNGIEAYYGSMAGETIRTSANVRMDVDAGGGNDLVLGSDVGDGISGGAGDDQIFGNGGPDNLAGGFGNDTIEGGAGADILTGEAGNDRFVFRGVDGANVDTITDFIIGEDKIQILRSGFLSPAQWGPGALDPARFVASANPSPINGTACFLFDNAGPGVGTLYWNDGSGSAQGLAVITTNNPLFFTAADFVLV